ncbi:probable cytochrome P450 4aa1 [Drosophila tropicalis]|uniref:probable cytochrome P450 4aa1 n=1 Tax=Drosophila tropicalis TaxID=46794 RepID=UPI0035ABBFA2
MFVEKLLQRATKSELCTVLALILVSLSVYRFYAHLQTYLRSVLLSLRLSGPPTLPFLGNCMLIKEKDLMRKRAAKAFDLYGSLIRIWVLLFPFFVVLQPEDLQVILSSKKHTNKVFFYRLMHNFLGDGLITSSGSKWSNHRKLIQPAFHLSLLGKFIDTFVDASQSLYEHLDDAAAVGSDLNIAKYVNNCVLNILNEAVLGVPIRKKNQELVDMEESPFRQGKLMIPTRFANPWLLWDGLYHWTKLANDELNQKKRLNDFTRQMIKRRREIMANCGNNNTDERKCLLDYMIEISESNPDFTEEDIVNEACTFMLAGQDSVGAAVAFTIFLLAQNPECQEKCCEELERIFDYTNRAPSMSDLREMRYMEMCIKESLRLYPSVPLIARKLGEEVSLNGGAYTLPAGSNVFICPYATHRLAHIYPEPEKFMPERFSPENAEHRHPYAFLPFSAGPRYCIGNRFAILEIKTIVSRLLRSYQLLPVPGRTTFEATFRITLRASGGLWVRLKPREHPITHTNSKNEMEIF